MKNCWGRDTGKNKVKGGEIIKVLFLTENIYPAQNASTNCLKSIVECLCEKGVECIFITNQKNVLNKEEYFVETNKVYNYGYQTGKKAFLKALNSYNWSYRKIKAAIIILFMTIIQKLLSIHPILLNLKMRGLAKYSAKIATKEEVNAVISIGAPFDFHTVGYLSHKIHKKKWIMYSFDPNHSHIAYKNPIYLTYENIYMVECAASIVTKLMYEEYKACSLNKYINKIIPLEFPNLTEKKYKPQEDEVILDNKYINCVFVGSLYYDIRNPEFLLQLIEHTNLRLYIVGKIYDGFPVDYFYDWQIKMHDRLIITGLLSQQAATNAMLQADVLINIGNNVANQLPSKIIDYISTGKPIVNIYKFKNCPSLKYMEKYPLCLNILENPLNDAIIKEFGSFCENNIGKNIEFELVSNKYSECTPGYVSDKLINIVCKDNAS